MRAGIEVGTCRRLAVALAWIVAVVGSGCDDNCDGGTWLVGKTSVCAATGSATVASPLATGFRPRCRSSTGTVAWAGAGATSVGITRSSASRNPRRGGNGIDCPSGCHNRSSATSTFPAAWTCHFSVIAGLDSMVTGKYLGLEPRWCQARSMSDLDRQRLRLSFELGWHCRRRCETFAITGGGASVAGCHVVEKRMCARGERLIAVARRSRWRFGRRSLQIATIVDGIYFPVGGAARKIWRLGRRSAARCHGELLGHRPAALPVVLARHSRHSGWKQQLCRGPVTEHEIAVGTDDAIDGDHVGRGPQRVTRRAVQPGRHAIGGLVELTGRRLPEEGPGAAGDREDRRWGPSNHRRRPPR